jgi:hypothetical protein
MNRKESEGIERTSGHGRSLLSERHQSRRVAPGVIGICLVMVLGSSLALVLVPGAQALSGPFHAALKVPSHYPTIGSAIGAAHPGDTIVVAPGTYVEQLTIDKSVNIVGAGVGKTIIESPAVLSVDALGNLWAIEIGHAATVMLSGLTLVVSLQCIIYPGLATPTPPVAYAGGGIGVGGSASLYLQSAVVTTAGGSEGAACGGPSPTTAGFQSFGTGVDFGLDYLTGSPSAAALLGFGAVSGVKISGFGFGGSGVSVGGGANSPPGSYALISNDQIITPSDDCGPDSGIGPAISVGVGGSASSATIVGNTLTGMPGSCNTGIIAYYGSSAYIASNTIEVQPFGAGITLGLSTATILFNSIMGSTTGVSGWGILMEGSSATIAFNRIGNFECDYYSVWAGLGLCGPSFESQIAAPGIADVSDAGLGTTIANNLVFNTDVGIELGEGCPGCVVKGNVVMNSFDYGLAGIDGSYSFLQNTAVGGTYGVGTIAYSADTTVTLVHVAIVSPSVAPYYYEVDFTGGTATISGT